MYHDVLSQSLLAFLRDDTGWSYTTCARTDAGGETNPKSCLLAAAWLYKEDSVDALRILKLTHRLTGLNVVRRGAMVHESGPGGHNAMHTDSVRI